MSQSYCTSLEITFFMNPSSSLLILLTIPSILLIPRPSATLLKYLATKWASKCSEYIAIKSSNPSISIYGLLLLYDKILLINESSNVSSFAIKLIIEYGISKSDNLYLAILELSSCFFKL